MSLKTRLAGTSRLAGLAAAALALSLLSACVTPQATMGANTLPPMRWDHLPGTEGWTASTLQALRGHGAALPLTVPQDIDTFCPGYRNAGIEDRRAFWAGLLSAIAKYESTWNPTAKGGGGRWIGLMQIAPGTAQAFDCTAQDRAGLVANQKLEKLAGQRVILEQHRLLDHGGVQRVGHRPAGARQGYPIGQQL